MKKIISLMTVLTLTVSFFALAGCKKNQNTDDVNDVSFTQKYSKQTISAPVEIVNVPESKEDIIEMFNTALDYVDIYCHRYTKHTKCDVGNVNIGSLSAASNAADAFMSVFGKTDVKNKYDYSSAPESFEKNFIKERFSATDVLSAEAKQENGNIILKITFPNEGNPSDKHGQLHKLSDNYISINKVNNSLDEFESSADSISVFASDITVTATISANDSSLKKLVAAYTESFTLTGVKLVELEGSSVTGAAKTVETYSEIEN